MKLLVIRHAIAQDREDFDGTNDDLRPLTEKGIKEFEKVAKFYKKIFKIEKIYSSPLLRAAQTAEILNERYKVDIQILKELRPEVSPELLFKKLNSEKIEGIAIVGHEPLLSEFIGYLVTGKSKSIVEMKKGSACFLEVDGVGRTEILNFLTPKAILELC